MSYGLESEEVITYFVELLFVVSPDFDTSVETEWASKILQQSEIPSFQLEHEFRERASAELESRTDKPGDSHHH